jgi:hypothetical protein
VHNVVIYLNYKLCGAYPSLDELTELCAFAYIMRARMSHVRADADAGDSRMCFGKWRLHVQQRNGLQTIAAKSDK